MNEPTDMDLKALVAEARREHGVAEREMPASDARPWFESAFGLAARVHWTYASQAWEPLRSALLHIALFALRAAWEAGRRTDPPEPERWVIRLRGLWLSSQVLARATSKIEEARIFPSEAAAKAHRETLNEEWAPKAVVERVHIPEPANEPTPLTHCRHHSKHLPACENCVAAQASAHDPSPPSPDVDALLTEADRRWERSRDRTALAPERVDLWGDLRLNHHLARALRAERERAEDAEASAKRGWDARDAQASAGGIARARMWGLEEHLRAVLAHGWPEGTTGPACVRAARAFLGGADGTAPTASGVGSVRDERPNCEPDAAWLRARWEESVNEHAATQAENTRLGHEVGRLRSLLAGERAGRERANEETRKALAAQNQAESRVAELEEAVRRLAAMVPAKGEA